MVELFKDGTLDSYDKIASMFVLGLSIASHRKVLVGLRERTPSKSCFGCEVLS